MSTTQPARFAPRRPEIDHESLAFLEERKARLRQRCAEGSPASPQSQTPPARPARPFGLPPGGLPLSEMIGPPLALLAMGALLFAFAVITP